MTTKKATTVKKGKGTKAEKAPKAEKTTTAPESKAAEVIAPVPVALLEAHPSLPSTERWLALFAGHYTETPARHAALEAALAPPPEPEQTKSKKGRASALPPTLPGAARPVPASAQDLPELTWAEPTPEPEPESTIEVAPDLEVEPEFDLFAQLAAEEQRNEAPDDFLARLQAQGEAAVDGRSSLFEEETDFAVRSSSDQSSPFITAVTDQSDDYEGQTMMLAAVTDDVLTDDYEGQTTTIAALTDDYEGQTTTIAAYTEEDEAPQFAEPSESTTMIAALTDEDLENLAAPNDDAATPKTRKSRKSSKKKKG